MTRNYDIAELRRLDLAHHMPAQQDYQLMENLGGSRIITRAEGCFIFDGDGNRILDAMAGLWCVAVGYGRRELVEVAAEQMTELPYYNTFFRTATPPPIELATKIAEITGNRLPHIFFNNSGSEAVDTAIRMIRYYWQLKGQPERNVLIARHNGYHGSTIAGAGLGGMAFMHAQGGPFVPGVEHVRQPYWFGEGRDMDPQAFGLLCARAIEDRILAVGPERVAAIVGEPIQGAGGVIIPPESYWPEVERIARRYGVLLMCDEVICGIGRTGHWWGHEYMGVQPDLITSAKGLSSGYLPISATAISEEIFQTLKTGGDFVHGFTYSGHPVAAAVALRNLDIIEREGLVERAHSDTGPHLAQALRRLADHELVGEVRSAGLIGAVEIVADKPSARRFGGTEGMAGPIVRDRCIANGVMVRAVRDSLVMSPPLIISHAEIDQIVDTIARSLEEASADLAALG